MSPIAAGTEPGLVVYWFGLKCLRIPGSGFFAICFLKYVYWFGLKYVLSHGGDPGSNPDARN
jgi:hypothetical protein